MTGAGEPYRWGGDESAFEIAAHLPLPSDDWVEAHSRPGFEWVGLGDPMRAISVLSDLTVTDPVAVNRAFGWFYSSRGRAEFEAGRLGRARTYQRRAAAHYRLARMGLGIE